MASSNFFMLFEHGNVSGIEKHPCIIMQFWNRSGISKIRGIS